VNELTQTFIGLKAVKATPMTRGQYNAYRGWTMPEGEKADDEGYLVEYLDGGAPNCVNHAGYVTWTPQEPFDNAHHAFAADRIESTLHVFHSALDNAASRN
jgi:hypothetical protein